LFTVFFAINSIWTGERLAESKPGDNNLGWAIVFFVFAGAVKFVKLRAFLHPKRIRL
jgi:hypothetical protein